MQLRPATPAEIVARNCLTHASWGAKLTLEQYLDRERRLAEHVFSEVNRETWVLAEGDALMASCESYRMRSILRDGETTDTGDTYGVGSVFVEPPLRGSGYATQLLGQLVIELSTRQGCHSSILFSQVGTPIYERVGYVPRPATSRVYSPAKNVDDTRVADPVKVDDIEKLLEARATGVSRPTFRVAPTADQIDWHLERSRFYAETLNKKSRFVPENVVGAKAGESWAIWAPDFRNDRLAILEMAPGLPDGTRVVIEAARRTGSKLDLKEVTLWENPENNDGLVGGESVKRQANIPMIAPLREGVSPDDWRDYTRALWV